MNNGEYWQKRFELLEQAAHQQGVQCYADIEKQYRQAQKQLEGQIAAWYQRFASNNGVTLAEAKRMLNAKELAELKWDVNQYIQYGQENAINGTWVKQLENASARFHISRLEALKLQTQQSMTLIFVLVAYRLDLVIGTNYIRDAVIIAFIANETISLVENAGLMGLPLPAVITKAIDILQKKTESEGK